MFAGSGITAIRTPPRSPQANAFAERWVCPLRHELLDRTIIWNDHQLRQLLVEYIDHYNMHRPHRGLHQRAPDDTDDAVSPARSDQVSRSSNTPLAAGSSTNTATPLEPPTTASDHGPLRPLGAPDHLDQRYHRPSTTTRDAEMSSLHPHPRRGIDRRSPNDTNDVVTVLPNQRIERHTICSGLINACRTAA